MKKTAIYIHGKGGNPVEAEHYKPLLPGYNVAGLEYSAQTPWEAEAEFPPLFDALTEGSEETLIIANSIGAFFAMQGLWQKHIDRALFISPVTDMEGMILSMLCAAGHTEEELEAAGELETPFGENLSWKYLSHVRENRPYWRTHTDILCGEKDALLDLSALDGFAKMHRSTLTTMPGGEHWFHTPEQTAFLDSWVREMLSE